jgi:small ligand-binding sensory domain FIST
MTPFVVGHASHPEWTGAFALVAAQLDAQLRAQPGSEGAARAGAPQVAGAAAAAGPSAPTLGLVYITDHYAAAAEPLLAALRQRWPGVAFAGTVGVGVAASGVEYFDEPAMVVMLAALPREQFQVFSGVAGLRSARSAAQRAATALVHVDPHTPELPELLHDLAERTETGYLFGGVTASRQRHVQLADGVFQGGLSGVALGAGIAVVSRVTQGCAPLGPRRRITASDGTVVLALDGQPALPQLLADLHLVRRGAAGEAMHPRALREAVPRLRRTLVGLTDAVPAGAGRAEATAAHDAARSRSDHTRRGSFGEEVRVRHLIGIDAQRQGFAVAETVHPGMGLAFCERDVEAARRDLMRMCTEVRDEIESRAEALQPLPRSTVAGLGDAPAGAAGHAGPAGLAGAAGPAAGAGNGALGAIYVSCSGRGGPHFGGPSAELRLVRRALGDVPLVGFFAAGEVAHRQLYGYTGVLTVFCAA